MATCKQEAPVRGEKMSERRRDRAEEEEEVSTGTPGPGPGPGPSRPQTILKIPETVEDFLRNFLQRSGLIQTVSSFETEWYGSAQKVLTEALPGVLFIPDVLTHRKLLLKELQKVHKDTKRLRQEALEALESLVRTRRERDFHRLQYRRVAEDKNRLIRDFRQLEKHLETYRPALRQLEDKYQAAVRRKTLLSLKKDRVDAPLDEEKPQLETERRDRDSRRAEDTEFPVVTPHLDNMKVHTWEKQSSFSLSFSFRAHQLPISCIDLHPQRLILASASEDHSWRMWRLQDDGEKVAQKVLTGEGHSDWLSGCTFHPDGAKLATTSGDCTVRLWDVPQGRCVLTLSGHLQPSWGSSFHWSGHFLASCSADATARLWDLNAQRCRLTLRRHAASVNSVCFLPSSDLLLTCSADRTLGLWDARQAVCTATFHGHQHPCNHAAASPAGSTVASCDSCGVIKLWDVRRPALAVATVDGGPLAAHQVAFSPSGRTLAAACGDGLVRLLEVESCLVSCLSGHGDGVQSVTFDHQGEAVMSAGSDGVISVWAEID